MNRFTFRTAQTRASRKTQGIAAGALVLGLALTASAKDAPSPKLPDTSSSSTGKSASKNHHWYQIGTASWYGEEFQGRKTAAGETFDMNGMTCAHPTLPMGTWLRVTNLKNRQTAFVRVNDRGPVFEGRIVDLSMAAARVLGLNGVGKVKLERVPPGDPALVEGLMAQIHMPIVLDTLTR